MRQTTIKPRLLLVRTRLKARSLKALPTFTACGNTSPPTRVRGVWFFVATYKVGDIIERASQGLLAGDVVENANVHNVVS